jgi:hypothetical protein
MIFFQRSQVNLFFWVLMAALMSGSILYGGNEILGEIEFAAATKIEKTSGVWIDGQYVGFVKELKGSKKILLLPGEHQVTVRQAGYKEFSQKVLFEPGQKQVVRVLMTPDPAAKYPDVTANVKFAVKPNRAAVFVEDQFVGYTDQFDGPGQWLQVAPGKHRVKITLPGYRPFETEINLVAYQKFELKTELVKGSVLNEGAPLVVKETSPEEAKPK